VCVCARARVCVCAVCVRDVCEWCVCVCVCVRESVCVFVWVRVCEIVCVCVFVCVSVCALCVVEIVQEACWQGRPLERWQKEDTLHLRRGMPCLAHSGIETSPAFGETRHTIRREHGIKSPQSITVFSLTSLRARAIPIHFSRWEILGVLECGEWLNYRWFLDSEIYPSVRTFQDCALTSGRSQKREIEKFIIRQPPKTIGRSHESLSSSQTSQIVRIFFNLRVFIKD